VDEGKGKMAQINLALLSWQQAEERFREQPAILIPVGSIEAHGPHLPLGADSLVAEAVAVRAAQRAPALVVPTISYGYAGMWRNFPGTLSTDPQNVRALAGDIIRALLPFGLRHFIFVNNHSGNEGPLELVARQFEAEQGIVIAHFYPWRIMAHLYARLFDDYAETGGHGAEPNASVLMYLFPDDVDMARAVADQVGSFNGFAMKGAGRMDFEGVPIEMYVDMSKINPSGVTSGHSFSATPERGQLLVERTVEALAGFIKAFRENV